MKQTTDIRGLIGVVHLPPLPGDPRHDGVSGIDAVLDAARRDCEALLQGGIDQVIVENFGSAPFARGAVDPFTVACITRAVDVCRDCGATVGVNVLRNDARAAIGIAAACQASFIRVNVWTGACVTDQGVIEGEAHDVSRYRTRLGSSVAILADVLVKHATPLGNSAPRALTRDTVERGLADGVIVTGDATGAPAGLEVLEEVAAAATGAPVFVGSGVTPERVASLSPYADGAIVGTYLKVDGEVTAPVDSGRVETMVQAWQNATK